MTLDDDGTLLGQIAGRYHGLVVPVSALVTSPLRSRRSWATSRNGGFVHPYKARVLLRLLVAQGAPASAVAEAFAELG